MPLGLRLVDGAPRWLAAVWLAGAIPGAASLWLPRGTLATVLASPYALATLTLAGYGATRAARTVVLGGHVDLPRAAPGRWRC